MEKAATQVGVSLDQESIKKLEQDLTAKNEQTAKFMKEQEMLKCTSMNGMSGISGSSMNNNNSGGSGH